MTEESEATGPITMNTWVGFTLSGLAGFGAALITLTLAFADARSAAATGQKVSAENAVELKMRGPLITEATLAATTAANAAASNAAYIRQVDTDMRERLRRLEQASAVAVAWRTNVLDRLGRLQIGMDKIVEARESGK